MIKSNTIGIVIFRKNQEGIEYLLLHHGGTYWNFPKGGPEKGETKLQTATRETKEETGITKIKFMDGFCSEYDYDFNTEIEGGIRQKIYRHGVFYLAEALEDKVKISDEHIDFGWFDFSTALTRLFYQNNQNVLKEANRFILKGRDFML